MRHWQLVWTLCEALWGSLGELDPDSEIQSEYRQRLQRRRAFSYWLSQSAARRIEEEVALSQHKSHVEATFSYLTGNRISEACRLAQQSGKQGKGWYHSSVLCVFIADSKAQKRHMKNLFFYFL